MATSNSYFARQNYRFLSTTDFNHHAQLSHDSPFELDESDIYHHPPLSRSRPTSASQSSVRGSSRSQPRRCCLQTDRSGKKSSGTPSSLPVNIPDWSKILKDEYRRRSDAVDDDDVDGSHLTSCWGGRWLGQGSHPSRFMKDREDFEREDLSRVRNSIWEKTGFQD
uniref:Uncharacterized protein n=1 Tax=Salix viminalis TaxID=40686 RepID=A0A6N2KM73_SALVM